MKWLDNLYDPTYIGCEFVAHADNNLKAELLPNKLAKGLNAMFDAGELQEVVVRLSGECFTKSNNWVRSVEALWSGGDWAERVRLWRDLRRFDGSDGELKAGIAESLARVD